MTIMDILIGESGLRKVRDRSVDFARKMYDPSVLDPTRTIAATRAVQGIDEDPYRRDALQSIYRDGGDMSIYGGNQAAAIAGVASADAARAGAVSQFETRMAMADIEAMERGQDQLAQITSQQRTIQATQEAAIEEADVMYEAEKSARKYELAGAAGTLGGVFAMTPVGQKTIDRLNNFVGSMFTKDTGAMFVEGMDNPAARIKDLQGSVAKINPMSGIGRQMAEGKDLGLDERIDAFTRNIQAKDMGQYGPMARKPIARAARSAVQQAVAQPPAPVNPVPAPGYFSDDPFRFTGIPDPTRWQEPAQGGFQVSRKPEEERQNPLRKFFTDLFTGQ